MTDGLRWQEVFSGAEVSIMNKKNGKVANEAALKKTYWREAPEARREALMPFLWTVMAKQGQVFGNRDKGSDAFVTMGSSFPILATARHCAVLQTRASTRTTKFQIQT